MKYGLIGEHLGHSFSKEIHEMLGFYTYEVKEIPQNAFDDFMKKKDFLAINVTIPYKEKVIPYLDAVSDIAKRIGAVNTIVRRGEKLYGYNTDYYGMKRIFLEQHVCMKHQKVLILGTGGTSKTAEVVCQDFQAKEIIKVSRTKQHDTKHNLVISYDEVYDHLDTEVIINTTPCGMYPDNESVIIDVTRFPNLKFVLDVIYNPLCTKLIQDARKNHIQTGTGLLMLVEQAVKASEIFLDQQIQDVTPRIYQMLFKKKQNLVFIGMPSCGKTTIGKSLAPELGKTFIDTDEEIEKKIGIKISDYFSLYGEAAFRDVEEEVIQTICKRDNLVIATGGGAILRKRNIERFKQNGCIYFIDRKLELLTPTDDRPLSSTKKDLEEKYQQRYLLYQASADYIIDGNQTIEEVKNQIKEAFQHETIGTEWTQSKYVRH